MSQGCVRPGDYHVVAGYAAYPASIQVEGFALFIRIQQRREVAVRVEHLAL